MIKVLGGVLIGVFVGAAVYELLNRRSPHVLHDMQDKAKRTVRAAVDAFSEGYHERGQDHRTVG